MSFHYNFSKNFGDVHVGYYNGDGYSKPEANDQQAVPDSGHSASVRDGEAGVPRLRITGFYDGDHYIKHDEKTRALFETTLTSTST